MNKLTTALVALLLCGCLAGCTAEMKKARRLARAEKSFDKGDFEEARLDYLGVLRADPRNAKAIRALGVILAEQGAALPAIPYLLKSRELHPADVVSRLKLARALLAIGESSEAKREAAAVLQQAPDNGEALSVLAEAARRPEEMTEAESALESFPQKESAYYHYASATIAMRKNDRTRAEADLQRALTADPKFPDALMALAQLAEAGGDTENARTRFKAAAENAPSRSPAPLRYAEFLVRTGALEEAKSAIAKITDVTPDFIPAWRVAAQIAIAQKDYKAASTHLDNIFTRDPQDVDGRILQSRVFILQGEPPKGIDILEKLDAGFKGRVPGIKLQLARALVANGNRAGAEVALTQALGIEPNFVDATIGLAELKIQSGQAAAAIELMVGLLRARPELPQPRIVLAGAYLVSGQPEAATGILHEQLKYWPKDLRAHSLLSAALRHQGKLAEARQQLMTAMQIAPREIALLAQLVELDLAEKNFEAALQRVRERMQAEPNSGAAQFLEGKVHFAQQNYDAAEAALQKAIALDPNFSEAYGLLAATYTAAGRLSDAASQAEAMVAKNPNNAQMLTTLALLREKLNEHQAAADAYEKVLALSPNFLPALNNLAHLLNEHLDQVDRAIELARRARASHPADPAVADTLGWALFKKKDYPQALALLQESVEKLGDDPEVRFHLGMALYMMGQTDGASAAFKLALSNSGDFPSRSQAQQRLKMIESGSGQQDLSQVDLEKLVAQQPEDVTGWMRLGEAREAANDPAKAAEAYERARGLNPNLLGANIRLARLYAGRLDRHDRALELAKKARELAPQDAGVAGTLGEIALRARNYSWAYSLLQESARQNAGDTAVQHNLGWALYYLGRVEEARQAMQKVPVGAPQHSDAAEFLALTNAEQDRARVKSLAPQMEAALKREPNYLPARVLRADLQATEGNTAAARASYEEILKQYPEFVPAQRELAVLYSETPDLLPKAQELAARARKALPGDPRAAQVLAHVSFKRGQYPYAIQLFQESAGKLPLDRIALYELGVAQIETGSAPEGVKHLRAAVVAGLDGAAAADATQRIAEAEKK